MLWLLKIQVHSATVFKLQADVGCIAGWASRHASCLIFHMGDKDRYTDADEPGLSAYRPRLSSSRPCIVNKGDDCRLFSDSRKIIAGQRSPLSSSRGLSVTLETRPRRQHTQFKLHIVYCEQIHSQPQSQETFSGFKGYVSRSDTAKNGGLLGTAVWRG